MYFFFFFFFWPGLATGSIDAPPTLNFLIHPIMVLSSVSKLCFAVHETSSQRVSTFFRCESSISLFLFFSPSFLVAVDLNSFYVVFLRNVRSIWEC